MDTETIMRNGNLETLKSVIEELENLEELTYNGYQSESISGGGGHYEGTYMGYFDKNDRDDMVERLKRIYNSLNY